LEDALVAGKGLGRRSPSRRRQGRKISSKGGDQERVSLREKGKVGEEKQREEMNLRPTERQSLDP